MDDDSQAPRHEEAWQRYDEAAARHERAGAENVSQLEAGRRFLDRHDALDDAVRADAHPGHDAKSPHVNE